MLFKKYLSLIYSLKKCWVFFSTSRAKRTEFLIIMYFSHNFDQMNSGRACATKTELIQGHSPLISPHKYLFWYTLSRSSLIFINVIYYQNKPLLITSSDGAFGPWPIKCFLLCLNAALRSEYMLFVPRGPLPA